jgi:phosphinothricin acetyltransferase
MIRTAQIADLESIVAIYNEAIEAGFQTGFTEPVKAEERIGWFYEHTADMYPLFVDIIDGKVAGWFSVSPYRAGRGAFRYSVEISYFIHSNYRKLGIGSQLLLHGINACRLLRYKTAIAIILDRNVASIRLMEKFGFEQWAFLPGVADFDGVECSHVYYGLKLNGSVA